MNPKQITEAIEKALTEAGIKIYRDTYDTSMSLVSTCPDHKWADAECWVGIFSDHVQRWQRNYPLNFSGAHPVGDRIEYNTVDEMIDAVKKLGTTRTANCWK